jgi:hypothetical protein
MEEQNKNLQTLLRGCKVCGDMSVKTKVHGKKVFSDENGKLWSGKTCPKCHVDEVNNRNKAKRKKAKESAPN